MAAIASRGGNFRNSLTKSCSLTSNVTGAVCSERSRAASALSTDEVSSRHSRTTVPPIVGQNEAPSSDRVPETLTEAISVFLRHPTVLEVLVGMVGMGYYRLSHPLTVTDTLGDASYHTLPVKQRAFTVGVSVAAFWILQEWFLHKYLLHSDTPWMGNVTLCWTSPANRRTL